MAIDSGETNGAGAEQLGALQFELKDHGSGGRHTLVLSGELDMAWAPALDATLHRLCSEETEAIVLDLSRLTFMDSTGLRAVLLAEELCEYHHCRLELIPGPQQVQRLFEVTGLLQRLPFRAGETTLERPQEARPPASDWSSSPSGSADASA